MTAVAEVAEVDEPLVRGMPGEALGPLARFGAQTFIFVGLFIAFRVEGFEFLPGLAPLALAMGVFPVLLLTPTRLMARLPVSLTLLLFVGWQVASVLWTDSPEGTGFRYLIELPILLGFILITGIISLKDLVPALLWMIRFSVLFTAVVIATVPTTRVHIDATGLSPDVPGWHGFFPHKNVMGPFLVFGLITILTFDRTRLLRPGMLVGICVLLVASDSVTSMISALLAVSIWVWVQLYRNLDLRNSSIFLISSVSVAVFALLGVISSLPLLATGAGKDVTFTGRTFIWDATFTAWTQRPWTGYGWGGVLGDVPITPTTAAIWRDTGFQVPHAHNGVLDVGIQLGIIGLALYLLLWLTTLADGMRMLRDQPKLAAWIVSVMTVQLFMALSENVFLGSGWLPILIMFRILLLRTEGLEFDAGTQLADRFRHQQVRSIRYRAM